MLDFQYPWLALLLPIPAMMLWILPRLCRVSHTAEEQSTVLAHPFLEVLEASFSASTPTEPPSERLQTILRILTWCLLVLALMNPRWMEEHTEVATEGYDLMLAVDTSRSMEALDFSVQGQRVSRMAVIKGVLGRFVEQRSGDRVGLILFGESAHVQAPMTHDASAIKIMLDNTMPRMAGDSTAIGDAIGLAVKKLRERPAESRILILVTDGENTAGSLPPIEAAKMADHYKIRIYTIGVGSKGLVPFPEKDGKIVQTRMEIDETLLTQVAQMTGGAYFRATDTQALEGIYQQINNLEKTKAESRSVMVPHSLYRWPLGLALFLLLMLAGLTLGHAQKGAE